MGFFSRLFKDSSFFSSEYTDKSLMSLAQVMSAHANWKSRFQKFTDNQLGYNLDPEVLEQYNDTELGRWIIQSDMLDMSEERKGQLGQLHQANMELHKVASSIARHVLAGNHAEIAKGKDQFATASRSVMVLLMVLVGEN